MTPVAAARVHSADWRAIGVGVRVVVTEPARLERAVALLATDLDALDLACSRFRPDAEIAGLDGSAGTPVPVSPLLYDALAAALRAARLTDGTVDPTLASAMAEAGYDRDFADVPLGDVGSGTIGPARLGAARVGPARVSVARAPRHRWQDIHLDPTARTVRVPAGVRLDLGATAKALAADRAAAAIAARCGCGVLVSLGGDIAVAGPAPRQGWDIRVQDATGHPDEPATGSSQLITVQSGGLATSSTTARRWCRDGLWQHHIIDPLTGVPAVSPWRTVSVAAASCLDANIASTASIVLGWAAPEWLAERGLTARLVHIDGTVYPVVAWPSERAA